MSSAEDLHEWLEHKGLGYAIPAFQKLGLTDLNGLNKLTPQELQKHKLSAAQARKVIVTINARRKPPIVSSEKGDVFDVFIQGNQATARDVSQALKLQLEIMNPALQVFCDFDDLFDGPGLEAVLERSANLILLVSGGCWGEVYFLRVLHYALRTHKNVIVLQDAKTHPEAVSAVIPAAHRALLDVVPDVVFFSRERATRDEAMMKIFERLAAKKPSVAANGALKRSQLGSARNLMVNTNGLPRIGGVSPRPPASDRSDSSSLHHSNNATPQKSPRVPPLPLLSSSSSTTNSSRPASMANLNIYVVNEQAHSPSVQSSVSPAAKPLAELAARAAPVPPTVAAPAAKRPPYTVSILSSWLRHEQRLSGGWLAIQGSGGGHRMDDALMKHVAPASFNGRFEATVDVSTETVLGDVWLVEIGFASVQLPEWRIDKIVVRDDSGLKWVFPVHRIVTRQTEAFRSSQACLAAKDSASGLQQRQEELRRRKEEYKSVASEEDLPAHLDLPYDLLPGEQKWPESDRSAHDFLQRQAKMLDQLSLASGVGSVAAVGSFEGYAQLSAAQPLPEGTHQWSTDAEFGRSILSGPLVRTLRRVKAMEKLPSGFAIEPDRLLKRLRAGRDLVLEMRAHRVYVVECPELEVLTRREYKHQHFCAPRILMYLTATGDFVPLAVQLLPPREPDASGHTEPVAIFYSDDPEGEWVSAKTYARSALLLRHELVTRTLHGCLVLEPITISFFRNISSAHPVHKLLRPHLGRVLATGSCVREQLLGRDGVYSQLFGFSHESAREIFKTAFASWRWEHCNPMDDYEARKMLWEFKELGGYVDDAPRLWQLIEAYVRSMLKQFYTLDYLVLEDSELQDWVREAGGAHGLARHGFPLQLASLDQLVEVVSMLIWQTSVHQALAAAPMYDTFGFVPSFPVRLEQAPPGSPQRGGRAPTMDTLLSELPRRGKAVEQVAFLYTVSVKLKSQPNLGVNSEFLFTDDVSQAALDAFRISLATLGDAIDERGSWPYLSPHRIPNAVTF